MVLVLAYILYVIARRDPFWKGVNVTDFIYLPIVILLRSLRWEVLRFWS